MRAISLRRTKVVNASLDEADEKATWLAAHPVGENYDLSGFSQIIPIGISSFREYIHSRGFKYWLTTEIPRVLTPDELTEALSSVPLHTVMNRVQIRRQTAEG